jgi:Leucine-rich repeat (LRR) protein
LVDCGITNLATFVDAGGLVNLSVPWNLIQSLADLPLFPALRTLDVRFNKIASIEDLYTTDEPPPNLQIVKIFGNPVCTPTVLKAIPSIFRQCDSLIPPGRELVMDLRLHLSQLAVKSVTELDLRGNCLTTLAPLEKLGSLRQLFVSRNQLSEIDFRSETLQFADFSCNQINTFPSPGAFPALETVLLNCNNIAYLCPFPGLTCLFAASNLIQETPSAKLFPNLIALTILDNPLRNSPTELRVLFQLPKLKILNGKMATPQLHAKARATFTGIVFAEDLPTIVPPGSTLLQLSGKDYRDVNALRSDSVHTVLLGDNQLTTIEWDPEAFPRLLSLKLSNNQLQSFNFLQFLSTLRQVDISGNHLTDSHLKSISMTRFPSLQSLILSNNSFKTCDGFPIANFPALETLDLSHNFIQTVSFNALEPLRTLKELNFAYNSLRKLENLAVPSLLSLDLSHNRVTVLDEVRGLARCTQLIQFWFNDNPLAQQASHRIRCLVYIRTLKELDGKVVSDSDLSQVRIILEQDTGGESLRSAQVATLPGQMARVNTVVLAPPLPSLQPQGQTQAKRFGMAPRRGGR